MNCLNLRLLIIHTSHKPAFLHVDGSTRFLALSWQVEGHVENVQVEAVTESTG